MVDEVKEHKSEVTEEQFLDAFATLIGDGEVCGACAFAFDTSGDNPKLLQILLNI